MFFYLWIPLAFRFSTEMEKENRLRRWGAKHGSVAIQGIQIKFDRDEATSYIDSQHKSGNDKKRA